MIPMLDLLNHRNDGSMSSVWIESGDLHLRGFGKAATLPYAKVRVCQCQCTRFVLGFGQPLARVREEATGTATSC